MSSDLQSVLCIMQLREIWFKNSARATHSQRSYRTLRENCRLLGVLRKIAFGIKTCSHFPDI